jgi:hypothetical protein
MKCEKYIKDLLKHTKHRKWLVKEIHKLEKIENKDSIQIHNLCSLYNTLSWIPFTKENEINKLCRECEFNVYRNS